MSTVLVVDVVGLRISKAAALLGYDCAIVTKNQDFGDLPRKSHQDDVPVYLSILNVRQPSVPPCNQSLPGSLVLRHFHKSFQAMTMVCTALALGRRSSTT